MTHTARRGFALLVTAAAVTTIALGSGGAPAGASSSYCGLTGFPASDSYVWTGAAGDHSWQTAANWKVGGLPATMPPGNPYDPNGPGNFDDASRDTDYVCIGGGASVTLGGQFFAGAVVAALDLGQNAHLTVTGNSRLWLVRAQSSAQPSNVRSGSVLDLQGATLGGKGQLVVAGTLNATTTASFPVTITTRWCDVGATCTAAPAARGLLTIATGGRLAVNGNPPAPGLGGINLEDERIVSNSGTVQLANKGFIAADHGTTIKNLAGATIDIANNYGIYEGRNHFGGLSVLNNAGLLRKSAGTGVSVVASTYQKVSGSTVRVLAGSLTIGRSTTSGGVSTPPATVSQGGTFGLGACPAVTDTNPAPCTTFTATSSNPQAATATLGATAGTSTVQVQTQTTGLPAGHVGQAVQFNTPTAHPTVSQPSVFVILYDTSVVGSRTVSTIVMKRAEDGSTSFVSIPNCLSTGVPPSGQASCVDKRGISGVSSAKLSNGDLRMVIRTTQNSRWVAT